MDEVDLVDRVGELEKGPGFSFVDIRQQANSNALVDIR
jgi:hypothetical protein